MVPDCDGTLGHVHEHKHQSNVSNDSRISTWGEQNRKVKIWISINFFVTGIFRMDFSIVLKRTEKRAKNTEDLMLVRRNILQMKQLNGSKVNLEELCRNKFVW